MAEAINIAGAVTIKTGTGASSALETLSAGGLRNGSEITWRDYDLEIKTDDNGGDEGPPADIQILGQSANIRMIFTRWDTAIAAKIRNRIKSSTLGTPSAVGTLMFADAFRLLVLTANDPYNFTRVVFREPIEMNQGTKYSTLVITGTAYKDASGILWNTTTS